MGIKKKRQAIRKCHKEKLVVNISFLKMLSQLQRDCFNNVYDVIKCTTLQYMQYDTNVIRYTTLRCDMI